MKIISLIIFAAAVFCSAEQVKDNKEDDSGFTLKTLVSDGYSLNSEKGTISFSKPDNTYVFKPTKDIKDSSGTIFSGRKIKLLPCNILEQTEKHLKSEKKESIDVKVWGIITKYDEENLLFINSVMPLSDKPKKEQPEKPKSKKQKEDDHSDSLLPIEQMEKLKKQSPISAEQTTIFQNVNPNHIEAGLTGKFADTGNGLVFRTQHMGRQLGSQEFRVIKSAKMARVKGAISRLPFRPLYRITGIAAEYNGDNYILLQTAVRKYSYGNFSGV
ncbi:hypothetical protein L21SP3_00428 [Sedimentisphaera cyanobacteriorum]|uniref:Uncharacterized protein n=1 Tax=Sedimentisphaera cyanobacteriorum TaxID=1940790 RepID=A0A1Q2HMQ1_9BACT|nr:hypothetical protein [Sedimentisphaera cyanobacteriorum]AQQ08640.1 hypothetical protein L21SP3_00428 [Sedimentisphaera cyanobacteriorum]